MMSIKRHTITLFASIALLIPTYTFSQSCANFTTLDTSDLLNNFTMIEIGFDCPDNTSTAVDVPMAIHWEISPIEGSNFSISCNPPDLITASVEDNVLSFAYGKAIPWSGGYAGVEIITPAGNLTTIAAKGVGDSVQIMDSTGSIRNLRDGGLRNAYYVISTIDMNYASDSASGTAEIQAPTVTVAMGGADGRVSVKGDVGKADMRGLRNVLAVQGNLTGNTTAIGAASEIKVSSTGGCDSFVDTGTDNTCQVTSVSVTVVDIDCLGSAGTATCKSDGGNSTSAAANDRASVPFACGLVFAFAAFIQSL